MTLFVGLDMAGTTGVCFGRPDTTPFATAVRAPSGGNDLGPYGAFWIRYYQTLFMQLVERAEPDEHIIVCAETPILPPKRWDKAESKMVGGTTLSTTRRLHSLGVIMEGVALMVAEETETTIEVYEGNVKSLKRELGGSGGASKSDMVYAARRCGIQLPEGKEAEDSADAFAAWLLAVRIKAPEHRGYWDRRLFSNVKLATA
jgi:hypothetical protein